METDWKQKYEAMVQRCKELHEAGNALTKQQMEIVCPQLAESEDERIRKRIKGLIYHNDALLDKDALLAWLEKQEEQKPDEVKPRFKIGDTLKKKNKDYTFVVDKIQGGFYLTSNKHFFPIEEQDSWELLEQKPVNNYLEWRNIVYYVLKEWLGIGQYMDMAPFNDIVKTLQERYSLPKPVEWNKATINGEPIPTENHSVNIPLAEWSEDYQEEYLRTRFAFYTYKDEDDVLYLSNVFVEEASRNKGFGKQILKAAENVAETIGASCIRVKVKQDSPANTWYRKHGYGYVAFEDGYDWLEKNAELSGKYGSIQIAQIKKCLDWLKSLRLTTKK